MDSSDLDAMVTTVILTVENMMTMISLQAKCAAPVEEENALVRCQLFHKIRVKLALMTIINDLITV